MEKPSLYDNIPQQQEELRLPPIERKILEILLNYRTPPKKPLDEDALSELNPSISTIDELVDWVLTVQKLRDSGYIGGVEIKRKTTETSGDVVKFSPNSYITLEGIKYLKGAV